VPRQKLKHFEDLKGWEHVLEPRWDTKGLPGTWGERVVLELACGGGDYTVALAQRFPDATLVGVDIKGARLWHGASKGLELGLWNLRFLRIQIEDLHRYFAPAEVDEIWITFPDPHPTKGTAKKRLSSPRFLEVYRQLLKPGGCVHLKTDNAALFDYSRETFAAAGFEAVRIVPDVYEAGFLDPLLQEVQTAYEKKYLKEGRTIRYGEFRLC